MIFDKKTTCILPCISMSRNIDKSNLGMVGPCCLYQQKKYFTYDYNEFWKSDELEEVRNKMIKGERPEQCIKCWKDEDAGLTSMRQSVNQSRLEPHIDRIGKPRDSFKVSEVSLLAGATCNLGCRMCQSHVSHGVHHVWQTIGRDTDTPTIYDDQAELLLKNNIDHIKYLTIEGGEPFYNNRIKVLLKWLVDNKHASHITLYVTTNATIMNEAIMENLKGFKEVVIIVGLDAVGEKHSYIRPNADWNKINENIDLLRDNGLNVIVMYSVSVLNIIHLPELVEWCKSRKLHMTQGSTVLDPVEIHPRNLPKSLRHMVDDRWKGHLAEPTHDCIPFIKQLDGYWKTKIYNYMPEWKQEYERV